MSGELYMYIQVDSAYNVPRYNIIFGYKVLFSFVPHTYYTISVRTFGYKDLVPFLLSRGVRYMRSRPVICKLFLRQNINILY